MCCCVEAAQEPQNPHRGQSCPAPSFASLTDAVISHSDLSQTFALRMATVTTDDVPEIQMLPPSTRAVPSKRSLTLPLPLTSRVRTNSTAGPNSPGSATSPRSRLFLRTDSITQKALHPSYVEHHLKKKQRRDRERNEVRTNDDNDDDVNEEIRLDNYSNPQQHARFH